MRWGGGLVLRQEGKESLLHIFVFTYLTLQILRSEFELFVAPINYLQKYWGEVDQLSIKSAVVMSVSHDHSVLQIIDADHS